MSWSHTVYLDCDDEVIVTECFEKFDLDMESAEDFFPGPRGMEADETIEMAVGILYAVWCVHPGRVNAAIEKMSNDKVSEVWNQIIAARTQIP